MTSKYIRLSLFTVNSMLRNDGRINIKVSNIVHLQLVNTQSVGLHLQATINNAIENRLSEA